MFRGNKLPPSSKNEISIVLVSDITHKSIYRYVDLLYHDQRSLLQFWHLLWPSAGKSSLNEFYIAISNNLKYKMFNFRLNF